METNILGGEDRLQCASLLLNKRRTPNKTVIGQLSIGHWIFSYCHTYSVMVHLDRRVMDV